MRIRKNRRVVRLTESDLQRIVKRTLKETMKNNLSENMRRFRTKNLNEEVEKTSLRNILDDLVKRMNDFIKTYTRENPDEKVSGQASIEAEPAGGGDVEFFINIPGRKSSAKGDHRPGFKAMQTITDPNQMNIRPGEYIRSVDRMYRIIDGYLKTKMIGLPNVSSEFIQGLRVALSAWAKQLRQADTSQKTN